MNLINGLRVHDAVVVNLTLGTRSEFEFRRVDSTSVRLALDGCIAFGAVGLRNNAIVLSAQLYDLATQQPSTEDWNVLVGGDFLPSEVDISEFKRAGSTLVSISCSFGGSISVLCNTVAVEQFE